MTYPASHDDQHLLTRLASGDGTALGQLFDSLSPRIFGLAITIVLNRQDAEEVLQDTFVEIWNCAAHFNSSRATADRWVAMMTRTRAIDRLRKRQARNRMLNAASAEPAAARRPSAEDVLSTSQTAARVRSALALLPSDQRSALELAYFEGLSQSEIALSTSTPLGTVKTRMRTGMIRLAAALP